MKNESNNEIVIEKGIPIPSRDSRAKWKTLSAKLEIGDSFTVDSKRQYMSAYLSITTQRGHKLTVRKIDGGRYRLWRVA